MAIATIYILLFLTLLFVYFQDRKERLVDLFLYLLMATFLGYINYSVNTLFIYSSFLNLTIVVFFLFSISVLVSIKERRLTNPINNIFGLGDLVFLVCLSIGLKTSDFLMFLILGNSFLYIFYFIKWKFNSSKIKETIPLAGDLSLLLIPFLSIKFFFTPIQLI